MVVDPFIFQHTQTTQVCILCKGYFGKRRSESCFSVCILCMFQCTFLYIYTKCVTQYTQTHFVYIIVCILCMCFCVYCVYNIVYSVYAKNSKIKMRK